MNYANIVKLVISIPYNSTKLLHMVQRHKFGSHMICISNDLDTGNIKTDGIISTC